MKRSHLTRGLVATALLASYATMLVTTTPAHAAGNNIVAVGSDTTQDVMGAILNGPGQYNVKALQPAALTVPADGGTCNTTITYHTPAAAGETLAPNGSGLGRNALIAEETAGPGGTPRGCMDIARSSAPPRGIGIGKDTATMEYYAFAMDSVSWASTSLAAPAAISQANLLAIYNCTITNWSGVPGGGSGPIQRYLPQSGSGTRAFFISDMLGGFDPTTVSSPTCPAVNQSVEENEAKQILPADHEKAIFPFSTGQWVFQANNSVNPTIDLRAGAKLGGQITTGLATNANTARWNDINVAYEPNVGTTPSTPVNEANIKLNTAAPDYFGIRYVFNVTDTVSPDYAGAQALAGFDNVAGGTKSPLCGNAKKTTLNSFGFAPLSITGGGTKNLAGSSCRKFIN